jgi:hypothetical protein
MRAERHSAGILDSIAYRDLIGLLDICNIPSKEAAIPIQIDERFTIRCKANVTNAPSGTQQALLIHWRRWAGEIPYINPIVPHGCQSLIASFVRRAEDHADDLTTWVRDSRWVLLWLGQIPQIYAGVPKCHKALPIFVQAGPGERPRIVKSIARQGRPAVRIQQQNIAAAFLVLDQYERITVIAESDQLLEIPSKD